MGSTLWEELSEQVLDEARLAPVSHSKEKSTSYLLSVRTCRALPGYEALIGRNVGRAVNVKRGRK